ncbi:MAG: MFS transporter, partial [Deltaproteobacteria bacterium]|nr:MFS transporter [Deltaproteobacteria bacterium]
DSLNKRLVATITTLLLTLSLLFFDYVTEASFWAIIPFIICFGTAWGGNVTTRVALLREHFGRSNFGTIMGFSTAFMMFGNMTGPTLTGWVFDRWGSYQGAWFAYAALSMLSAAIIALTPPVKK